MHIIENLRMGFLWSCCWAISVSPKDNGMITKWVWKLLTRVLAEGGGELHRQEGKEFKVILRYLVSWRLALTTLRSYLQKKKGRKKRNNKNGWWARSRHVVT